MRCIVVSSLTSRLIICLHFLVRLLINRGNKAKIVEFSPTSDWQRKEDMNASKTKWDSRSTFQLHFANERRTWRELSRWPHDWVSLNLHIFTWQTIFAKQGRTIWLAAECGDYWSSDLWDVDVQSTDKKVNEIVPPPYKLAPDAHSMANLNVSSVLFHRLAPNIYAGDSILAQDHLTLEK